MLYPKILRKHRNILVHVKLTLESKRRKKQPLFKLHCDAFPTSRKAQAILCLSDINISRLPVLIVFKVKLLHPIVLMHQKNHHWSYKKAEHLHVYEERSDD